MSGLLPYAVTVLVTIAATVGGIFALQSRADEGGYKRCSLEITTNEVKELKESIKGINDAFSKVQIYEDKINQDKDGDLAPVLLNTLDELRKRHPSN